MYKNKAMKKIKFGVIDCSINDLLFDVEIRNEENLKLNINLFSTQKLRIFIAVYLEGVRLIDNLSL